MAFSLMRSVLEETFRLLSEVIPKDFISAYMFENGAIDVKVWCRLRGFAKTLTIL